MPGELEGTVKINTKVISLKSFESTLHELFISHRIQIILKHGILIERSQKISRLNINFFII